MKSCIDKIAIGDKILVDGFTFKVHTIQPNGFYSELGILMATKAWLLVNYKKVKIIKSK